jgi:hypothetical protein
MKMPHTPYHWILVALVLIALLLTLSEVHGQGSAAAVFEGRPALAGAQAGQGAQAGPPQGGLGVQGNEAAERGIRLRKPSGLDGMPQGKRDDSVAGAASADMSSGKEVASQRNKSLLTKDQRASAKKGKRAAKRTISRARHGVGEIDSSTAPAAR